jgi:phospholipid/cholesterol/gamma-HCH transport system permease protein
MAGVGTSVERNGRTAVVRVRGDVIVPTVRSLHATLRRLSRRRDLKKVVIDFGDVGRLDSSGVAVVALARRSFERSGKELTLDGLGDHHRAAFELAPTTPKSPTARQAEPGWLETIGDRMIALRATLGELYRLVSETLRQAALVIMRRRKLPQGSIGQHVLLMGADALFIVGLLSFLLGTTIAFQGVVQLEKFGAGVFVADGVGWSMVREFSPLITAIVLTGRTGAAIAAELGSMRVGAEIDALTAMGVSPIRFLVVPRLAALTFVQPALTLMSMFIGISGGMLVALLLVDMNPMNFWGRIVDRVSFADVMHGLGKSYVFAWIIGFTGSHLGFQASGDASSVGKATTRTVVVSVFLIVVVDAVFATISTLTGAR